MQPIRCFLVEDSGVSKVTLRRYCQYDKPHRACSVHPYGYHNATVEIGEIPTVKTGDCYLASLDTPRDDPRWPTHCVCGYEFAPEDDWQTSQDEFMVPAPGNEGVEPNRWVRRELPAGAMYFPCWMQPKPDNSWTGIGFSEPTDGSVLTVICPQNPDGTGQAEWIVDGYCSNCDRKGERHHCWCRHGQAPWITVDKTPPDDGLGTCNAGAGSIWIGMPQGWHGFLRDGWLVDA